MTKRALVLRDGPGGNAWKTGVIAGLQESGAAYPASVRTIAIRGERYAEGPRSSTTTQLAAGHDRVLMALIRIAGTEVDAQSRAAAAQLDAGIPIGRCLAREYWN